MTAMPSWTLMTLLERRCAFWRLLESGDWSTLEHLPLDAWTTIATWALGTPARQAMPLVVVERLIEFCTAEAWVDLAIWAIVNEQELLIARSLESLRNEKGDPWTTMSILTAWSMGRRVIAEKLEATRGWDQGWDDAWVDDRRFQTVLAPNLWQPTEVQEAFALAVERSIQAAIELGRPTNVDRAFAVVIAKGHNALQRVLLPHADLFHRTYRNNTALLFSVQHDRLWLTEALLARDASPEHRLMANDHGEHALLSAMDRDRGEALGNLLTFKDAVNLGVKGERENEKFHQGVTPWMVCQELSVDAMLPLADPTSRDEKGYTALMHMAFHGHTQKIQEWLPFVDPLEASLDGTTALMLAAANGHTNAVKCLIPRSDVQAEDTKGMTAFLKALEAGHSDVAECLMPFSDVLHTNNNNSNALLLASYGGCTAMVQRLLQHLDANVVNRFNNNALISAACQGHLEIVKILLPSCDPKHAGDYQKTALIHASENGHLDMVEALLPFSEPDHKDEDHPDDDAKTALQYAIRAGHADVVQRLMKDADQQFIENGATLLDDAKTNNDGMAMLAMIASHPLITDQHRDVFYRHWPASSHADVCLSFDSREPFDTAAAQYYDQPCEFPKSLQKLVPVHGWNALMMAVLHNDESSFQACCTPENVHHTSRGGWNALMVAAITGRTTMVERLMAHATLESSTRSGKNAVMLAATGQFTEVLDQLLPNVRTHFLIEQCSNLLTVAVHNDFRSAIKKFKIIARRGDLPLELREAFKQQCNWFYAKQRDKDWWRWEILDEAICPLPAEAYGEVFDKIVGMGLTVVETLPKCWERWREHLRTTTVVSGNPAQRKRL